MSFLNPLALLGLASLAVPLLLLFFLNRKRVVLYWAAYQWMNETIVRHERQFQLNDLLKLLAKLLLLAALVLLVARPYLRSTGGGGRTLVVFDTSPSMAAEVAGQSRLDKARQDFTRFLQSRRGGIALARFDGKLAPVLSEFSSDRARLTTELAALEIGPQFAGGRPGEQVDQTVRRLRCEDRHPRSLVGEVHPDVHQEPDIRFLTDSWC